MLVHLKQQLHKLCLAYIEQRIATAKSAISAAREASAGDGKSSAGDKYETTREMMQQEIDRNQLQLAATIKLRQVLERISVERKTDVVQVGSLVYTNNGTFYISVSAGLLVIEGKEYYAVSVSTPVGNILIGKKGGDAVEFNGRIYKILAVV